MELEQLRAMLNQLEPGMALSVPKSWIKVNVEADDDAQRDLKTIDLVTEHNCTWERDAAGEQFTFSKQALCDG